MSEGAHMRATPLVPCAHAMTGQPRRGGDPAGISTAPEAATGVPSSARDT